MMNLKTKDSDDRISRGSVCESFMVNLTFNKAIVSISVHLLNQIVTCNQSIRIIRHLGCYQTNETSISRMNLCRSCI